MVAHVAIIVHQDSTTTLSVFHATALKLEVFKQFVITLENAHASKTLLESVVISV